MLSTNNEQEELYYFSNDLLDSFNENDLKVLIEGIVNGYCLGKVIVHVTYVFDEEGGV